uniref:Defensin beta 126 n=1 Tax=Pipistrellus kuhlii TaxID=59472 RepID=A0A7J7Y8W2_PIPKU|nr:defensin beta 126 [Pipistrellus kuhlii]
MKYLFLALAIFLLLAQLVSGSWYVKKCASKTGNCRSRCRNGELQIKSQTAKCSKEKICCVLNGKQLNPLLCDSELMNTTSGHTPMWGNMTSPQPGTERTPEDPTAKP